MKRPVSFCEVCDRLGLGLERHSYPVAIFVKERVELEEIGDGLLINFSKVSQLNHVHTPLPGF